MNVTFYDQLFPFCVGITVGIFLTAGVVAVWMAIGRREFVKQFHVRSEP